MSGRDEESLNGSVWSGGDIGSEARCQKRPEVVAGAGRAATQGALAGHKQSLGKVESRPCPAPPPHAEFVVRQLCVSGTALPGLISPGRSQSERGHLHSESPSTSPFQPDCRQYPLRAHLRPPQTLSGRSSASLGKLVEGFPRQDAHRSAGSWAGWGGDPGLGSFPDPGGENGRNAGRIPGAQGRTCRQEVPCVHCPSDASHSGANAWIGAGAHPAFGWGVALNLPRPPGGGGRNPSRAASSQDHAASIPARCEREQARGAPG